MNDPPAAREPPGLAAIFSTFLVIGSISFGVNPVFVIAACGAVGWFVFR